MRKLIALLLTVILVMSLATVAFAEEIEYAPSNETTFTIEKTYTTDAKDVNNADIYPSEKLTFVSTAEEGNPDRSKNLTIGEVDVSGASTMITVTVPSFDVAGVYNFTIKEQAPAANNHAGVSYNTTTEIKVIVLVEYDQEKEQLVIGNPKSDAAEEGIQYYFIKDTGTEGTPVKVDEIINAYNTGKITVDKLVTGNMANKNDTFTANIKLTLPAGSVITTPITVGGLSVAATEWENGVYETTVTISEAADAVTIEDIPVGTKVEVSEADDENYTFVKIAKDGVDVMNADGETYAASAEVTIADDTETAFVITNNYDLGVATGVITDSAPYILLIAVSAVAAVLFIIKRRSASF